MWRIINITLTNTFFLKWRLSVEILFKLNTLYLTSVFSKLCFVKELQGAHELSEKLIINQINHVKLQQSKRNIKNY